MTDLQFKALLEELSTTRTLVEGTDRRVRDQGEKLDRIEARVSTHDEKLDRIEALQALTERRLGAHDEKLGRLEARQGEQGDKIDALKRHFDVVAESLIAKIQLVAEGVASVSDRMENSQREFAKEFAETRTMIQLSYVELDRRMRFLETSLEVLQSRVTRLESTASV